MRYFLGLFAMLLTLCTSLRADAQILVGPRVGFDLGDPGGLVVGADALLRPEIAPVELQAALDYYFVNEDDFLNVDPGDVSVTVFNLSANGLYRFIIDNETFTPFAGLGPSVTFARVDGDGGIPSSTETKLGLNLTGGTHLNLAGFKPYAQANVKVGGGDVDLFSVLLGFRFGVGGD